MECVNAIPDAAAAASACRVHPVLELSHEPPDLQLAQLLYATCTQRACAPLAHNAHTLTRSRSLALTRTLTLAQSPTRTGGAARRQEAEQPVSIRNTRRAHGCARGLGQTRVRRTVSNGGAARRRNRAVVGSGAAVGAAESTQPPGLALRSLTLEGAMEKLDRRCSDIQVAGP